MSQLASNIIPPKGLWTLKLQDFYKGFVKSCGGLVVTVIIKMIQNKFQFPSYTEIEPFLEATAYFFFSYLGFNALTNNVGQLFTKDKPIVAVDKEHLENLEAKTNG